MGTLTGHAVPGLFFLAFGFWWLTQIPRRQVFCKRRQVAFYGSATYNIRGIGCCSQLPVEGIAKVTATVIGMAGELLASTDYGQSDHIVYMGDIQHVTMYLFFFLSGLVDLLVHRGCRAVPPGLDYATAALAFMVEWLLFSNHLHGRSMLDVHVHSLLLYVIAACAAVILLEYKYQDNLLLSLSRCVVVILQGTWFLQIGFILYPPSPSFSTWDTSDHSNVMVATICFIWHLGLCATFVMVAFVFLSRTYEKCCATFELDTGDDLAMDELLEDDEPNRCVNSDTDSH